MAALALIGCGKGGGENIAVVNGEPIPSSEFSKYLERKPIVQVVTNSGLVELPVAGSLGFQALRDLINRRILFQLAKDDNVYPSDADVNAELEFQRKRRPDFIQQLTAQGYTIDDIKKDLTLDLTKERILTKNVKVTPEEADKFIKENPSKFEQPQQAKLRIIAVRDAAGKKQVDQELANGTPFGQVAARYSIAPGARQSQGLYSETVVQRMQPALQAIVNGTQELKSTDWKQDGGQFVKIYVEQKVAAKPVPIDATMKEYVRRQLALQKGSEATDLGKRLIEKLKQAKIDVVAPAYKTPWETAFKNLQEQDVQAGTGTGTTPGGAAPGGAPAGGASGAPAPSTAGNK